METIYKYTIDPNKEAIIMPVGAEILSVSFQHDSFCMWAKVSPEATVHPRRFKVFGTGHEIPTEIEDSLKFIGTGFLGRLVFHAFEVL